jgi:predicted RNA-binding Zn ribbon-like protein
MKAALRTAPVPLSADPGLPFKYVGGDPSVDLVNTVDWTSNGPDFERLTNYERLTHWAEEAGLLSAVDAKRLRQQAAAHPRKAKAAYEAARWLRWVLQRVYEKIAAGEPPGPPLDDFNALLSEALGHLRIASTGGWDWQGRGEDLESLLWPVVWAAASLLTSAEADRLRVCGGPDCGWMYVDRSRNGLRRWCQMETCGTREKSRRRQRRADPV